MSKGRPFGHKGYALPGTKKPARAASPVIRDLFTLIDEASLPASAIAAETGCHVVSLSRWKHGRSTPMITEVEAIAAVLGYRLVLERSDV
jgi:DNA invertase Pin-like site-specific DNA recombinase